MEIPYINQVFRLILLLVIFCQSVKCILGKSQLCEVETGQTNIILDIEESRGNNIGQKTNPPELPIFGDPFTEIALDLVFNKGNRTFKLVGKQLQLLQPLDRDEENLSHIVFQISCTIRSLQKKRNIPIIVRVSDVNDNPPKFVNTPYETTIAEETPVGTTVFKNIQALDKDAGVNGLVEYFVVEGKENVIEDDKLASEDGYGTFTISFPHQGQVTVAKNLDYEKVKRYYVTIVASDRARNISERMSSTTTLTINVADSDDLDPSFIYRGCVLLDGACINPEYYASVPAGSVQGVLSVSPERIQAIDLDTIEAPIRYSFDSGMPGNYADYFAIDEQKGVLQQIKAVDTSTAKKYDIVVKAEEVSEAKRFTTAKLVINVKPVDVNPPVIVVSNTKGYVNEGSAIGTKVLDHNNKPIVFQTTDADLGDDDPKPDYIYELTTPSFSVNSDGVLIVNEDGLDRDPPNPVNLTFQMVAREPNTNAASAPLSLTVYLRDVNDNVPKIQMIPPISINAGDGKRVIAQITATDNDEGDNAIIFFSIYHVSNNGLKKFEINKTSGELYSVSRLIVGEQFSITVQATDNGGLSSQAIAEVSVAPGPNTKPPVFEKNAYKVQVSEGAEINSTVIVIKAEDPEGDPVLYSIASGNDLRQFSVGRENGIISVIRKLDRESLTTYQLIVKADDNGGLYSSAIVIITVTDINDNNPEFDETTLPYEFQVDESKTEEYVGTVFATDADDGINAAISYSIPSDVPFRINKTSGEIRTRGKLDFEKQTEYKFVVTAKDGAPDSRLGTASVTVFVKDLPDEVPKFLNPVLDVHVPENLPDYVITKVQAFDPDSIKDITYTLRKGSKDFFMITPNTGEIKTIRGLDFEKQQRYELIVGTIQNDGEDPGDFLSVTIHVDDVNDIAPVFKSVPGPVTVSDEDPIGTIIERMPAFDGDGSPPGNIIRYELVGKGKSLKYFQIDADTGDVRIKDDLQKSGDTEYQLDVRAYDLGEPQLSTNTSFLVFVRHVLSETNPPNSNESFDTKYPTDKRSFGLAFIDDSYTTVVPETNGVNSTIKKIQVMNSKNSARNGPAFDCEIIDGNSDSIFGVVTEDHACIFTLLKKLDYESKSVYDVELKLVSSKYFVNPEKSTTRVKILVQDENDNPPVFVFISSKLKGRKDTFYPVVSPDVDIDTQVFQVKATDQDSGKFGVVLYKLFDEEENSNVVYDQPTSYFTIDKDSGVIRTKKSLRNVNNFPMKFYVEARDNDGDEEGSHKTLARMVVNKITDDNRMTLHVVDTPPSQVRNHQNELEELLAEKTNLIAGIERVSNRKMMNDNGTIIENPEETDIWFYTIDTESENILKRSDNLLKDSLLDLTSQSEIKSAASEIIGGNIICICPPLEPKQHIQKVKAAIAVNDEVFPFALLAISLVILVLGTVGIIYICVSWSKYKHFKDRVRQYSAPASPTRYDPVIVGSQTDDNVSNLKEYETQVLAMAVPIDGDDDLQLDFSAKNHNFNLDNVTYLTHKDSNGHTSPVHSEATTATIATLRRHNYNNNMNNMNNKYYSNTYNRSNGTLPGTLTLGRINSHMNNNNIPNNTFSTMGRRVSGIKSFGSQNELATNTLGRNNNLPITNPLFLRNNVDIGSVSATNENVTFGSRPGFSYLNEFDRSEAETTTEL
ncbi:hypothetical protein ACFFRR_007314 [Megaselia abdita]